MQSRSTFLVILSIFLAFLGNAALGEKQSDQEVIKSLAEKVVAGTNVRGAPNKPTDDLDKLYKVLSEQVSKELEGEATTAGMTKEQYVADRASYEKFVAALKDVPFDSMEKADFLVAVLKNKIRLKIQESAPVGGDRNFATAEKVLDPMGEKFLKDLQSPASAD
jgi:hypothetical protein